MAEYLLCSTILIEGPLSGKTVVSDAAPLPVTLDGSTITINGTQVSVTYAAVNIAASGDNQVVAAVTSKKIRVLGLAIASAGAVTNTIGSDLAGSFVALSGAMSMITGTPLVLPFTSAGWFETAAGKALNFKLGGAIQVSGVLAYVSY